MMHRRNLLWLLPLVLILSFPLWRPPIAAFLAPPVSDPSEREKQSEARDHDFAMENITIHQSEKGQKTAVIHAEKAMTAERPNEYLLDRIDSDLYDDDGGLTHVVADSGHYNLPRKQLHLAGNVVIVSKAENYTMKTEVLYYDGGKRQLYCPEATRMDGKGISIAGTSLRHNMNTGVYTVGGRVFCTIEGYQE